MTRRWRGESFVNAVSRFYDLDSVGDTAGRNSAKSDMLPLAVLFLSIIAHVSFSIKSLEASSGFFGDTEILHARTILHAEMTLCFLPGISTIAAVACVRSASGPLVCHRKPSLLCIEVHRVAPRGLCSSSSRAYPRNSFSEVYVESFDDISDFRYSSHESDLEFLAQGGISDYSRVQFRHLPDLHAIRNYSHQKFSFLIFLLVVIAEIAEIIWRLMFRSE